MINHSINRNAYNQVTQITLIEATRTHDNSYPSQLEPKTTRTQDNSYPPGYELPWVRVVLGTSCPDPRND